ncbi:22435_t:CDS:2, partial [Racocetra persica]
EVNETTLFNRDNEVKETTSFKREEVKETLFNRDNEVKETTFNRDNEIKETSHNKVKETSLFVDIVDNQLELPGIKKGETNDLAIINQPKQVENSLPIMTPPPVENFVPSRKAISSHGGLRRYINEPVHNPVPHRHRYEDQDSYESYDYIPSRLSSSYNSLDLPSPRQHDLHPHRAYTDPSKRGPSVADMRDRFMSMSDERRSMSPTIRDCPTPRHGRVSDLTSRFGGERRNPKRYGATNNPRITHVDDYRYDGDRGYRSRIGYMDNRYYDQSHGDAILSDIPRNHHCNCYDCQQAALENSDNRIQHHSHYNDP